MARAKRAPEPPKRGRGRPRKIHSAPPVGVLPRIDVPLDEASGIALLTYCHEHGGTMQDAVRALAASWGQSEAVKDAHQAWRAGR